MLTTLVHAHASRAGDVGEVAARQAEISGGFNGDLVVEAHRDLQAGMAGGGGLETGCRW